MNLFDGAVELTLEATVLGRRVVVRQMANAEHWDNPDLRPHIERGLRMALLAEIVKVWPMEISVRR